jgi:hypothetical protein
MRKKLEQNARNIKGVLGSPNIVFAKLNLCPFGSKIFICLGINKFCVKVSNIFDFSKKSQKTPWTCLK